MDRETLKHLSKLCRIDLTEEETEHLFENLRDTIRYVEQLQEVDTEGVPPTHHVLGETADVMRDDKTGVVLDRDEFLKNSPDHVGGMIRVPPVIKRG